MDYFVSRLYASDRDQSASRLVTTKFHCTVSSRVASRVPRDRSFAPRLFFSLDIAMYRPAAIARHCNIVNETRKGMRASEGAKRPWKQRATEEMCETSGGRRKRKRK